VLCEITRRTQPTNLYNSLVVNVIYITEKIVTDCAQFCSRCRILFQWNLTTIAPKVFAFAAFIQFVVHIITVISNLSETVISTEQLDVHSNATVTIFYPIEQQTTSIEHHLHTWVSHNGRIAHLLCTLFGNSIPYSQSVQVLILLSYYIHIQNTSSFPAIEAVQLFTPFGIWQIWICVCSPNCVWLRFSIILLSN